MVEPLKVYANDIRLSGQLMVLKEDILLDRKGARCGSYLSSGREGLWWYPCCGSKLRVNPRTQQTQEEEEEEGLQCICLTLEKWESSLDLTETMAASCSKCEIEFIILILNCAECEV